MKTQAGALLSSIKIDHGGERKIGAQLFMGLRDIILSGGVQPGERLPASRTLARELEVSRTTVIDALDRLVAEGLLEARVGAGTFVNAALSAQPARRSAPDRAVHAAPRLSRAAAKAAGSFAARERLPHRSAPFITALPALDAFPMSHWARLSARHWRQGRETVMGYGEPYGLPRLRRAIAAHLNAGRGIKCDPEQIFITGGAQQAFSLISALLLDPGGKVWFENPGAIGARNAFIANGADLVPVDVDREGLCVADGLEKAPDFKLAFVTPSHQQPLGHVMSLPRRLALLRVAEAADAFIVEDDYDGDFYYGNQPLPPLKSIDTQDRVIYVGTFSKSLFPALRLGFVLSPAGMIESFQQISKSWLSGVPTAPQAITAEFMDEGLFATHVRLMRRTYKARHDMLLKASAALAGAIDVEPASSGFHTIGYLRPGLDENQLVTKAAEQGIILAPLGRYCLSPVERRGVVLGFGGVNPDEIQRGVERLRKTPGLMC